MVAALFQLVIFFRVVSSSLLHHLRDLHYILNQKCIFAFRGLWFLDFLLANRYSLMLNLISFLFFLIYGRVYASLQLIYVFVVSVVSICLVVCRCYFKRLSLCWLFVALVSFISSTRLFYDQRIYIFLFSMIFLMTFNALKT